MREQNRLPIRFSLVSAIVWLLVAGGLIFLLWQLINRISVGNMPISTATPNQTQVYQTIAALLTPKQAVPTETASQTSTPSPIKKPTQLTSIPLPSQNTTLTPGESISSATPEIPCDRAAAGTRIGLPLPG